MQHQDLTTTEATPLLADSKSAAAPVADTKTALSDPPEELVCIISCDIAGIPVKLPPEKATYDLYSLETHAEKSIKFTAPQTRAPIREIVFDEKLDALRQTFPNQRPILEKEKIRLSQVFAKKGAKIIGFPALPEHEIAVEVADALQDDLDRDPANRSRRFEFSSAVTVLTSCYMLLLNDFTVVTHPTYHPSALTVAAAAVLVPTLTTPLSPYRFISSYFSGLAASITHIGIYTLAEQNGYTRLAANNIAAISTATIGAAIAHGPYLAKKAFRVTKGLCASVCGLFARRQPIAADAPIAAAPPRGQAANPV